VDVFSSRPCLAMSSMCIFMDSCVYVSSNCNFVVSVSNDVGGTNPTEH